MTMSVDCCWWSPPAISIPSSRAYGALSGRRGTQPVTVGLALELCTIPSVSRRARAALGPDGALRRWLLIDEHDDDELWLERPLNASADVLDALLGQVATVPRWDLPLAADGPDASELAGLDSLHQASAEIGAALVAGSSLTWVLDGAPGSAGSAAALLGYRSAGIACAVVQLRLRAAGSGVVAALLQTISWAGCRGLGLVVVPGDPLTGSGQAESVARLLFASPVPVVVVSRDRWDPRWYSDVPIVVPAGPLSPDDRLALWQRYLGDAVADDSVRSFPLDPEQIRAAARQVTARRQLGDARPLVDQIGAAVRAIAGSRQSGHADARLPLTLADLQLEPLAQAELVRMCGWVAHRDDVVAGTELFTDGIGASGLCALFSGRPGTGKTMAAQVVADVAGLDLLRVNLATVVDKYIGETEKNLERIFAEAEQANVVLFFDEADALFGNRSAVNDARDRYANQEVAYLLQRMERFDGHQHPGDQHARQHRPGVLPADPVRDPLRRPRPADPATPLVPIPRPGAGRRSGRYPRSDRLRRLGADRRRDPQHRGIRLVRCGDRRNRHRSASSAGRGEAGVREARSAAAGRAVAHRAVSGPYSCSSKNGPRWWRWPSLSM